MALRVGRKTASIKSNPVFNNYHLLLLQLHCSLLTERCYTHGQVGFLIMIILLTERCNIHGQVGFLIMIILLTERCYTHGQVGFLIMIILLT